MTTRRKFLSTVALTATAAPWLLGQETLRRSRWEMIAYDEPSATPAFRPDPSTWSDATITAAWIGQSTVLLNFLGTWILTDPVFSSRIGLNLAGLFTLGPRRLVEPALTIGQIPRLDLILLSHAHMDHLDLPSLEQLDRTTPVIMAKNTADVIENLGYRTVYELDWQQWTQIGDLRIEALEVKHFGWRYPWELDRSRGDRDGRSYNAYLLSLHGHHVVFGGDTAYQENFSVIGNRGLTLDLAIMPIGAYDPWISNHASPEQALAMADQMNAYHVMPVHWHTFIQSEEPTLEPIQRFKKAAADRPGRVVLDSIGQTWAMNSPTAEQREPAGQGIHTTTTGQ
jgi:L-ascorbate metabolism protein UlaG (beta-lactamase superfamily)